MNWNRLTQKKEALDQLRPLPPALVSNLAEWFRVELTYTSNAIEGNTLTRRETALVVEKGLTVGGKTLVEHLEATNHVAALDWVMGRVTQDTLSRHDVMEIHRHILKGIDDDNAGCIRSIPIRISGSTVVLPSPRKVLDLMDDFGEWLALPDATHAIEFAAEAHYRLVSIHPFTDGNGRTARLLMNMILLMNGYPPAVIRKQDRDIYIRSLETAQLGGDKADYYNVIAKAVSRSLDIYLKAARGEQPDDLGKLIKIGELANEVNEPISTLRHWIAHDLLSVADATTSGYQLFNDHSIQTVKQIQALKSKRLTLKEIKQAMQT